jgi:hypothetical protein
MICERALSQKIDRRRIACQELSSCEVSALHKALPAQKATFKAIVKVGCNKKIFDKN